MRIVGGICGVILLAACQQAPAPDAAPQPDQAEEIVTTERDILDRTDDTCGKAAMRKYLGKQADTIPASELPQGTRILAPGNMATMDYIRGRLNILTDPDGMVIGMRCG